MTDDDETMGRPRLPFAERYARHTNTTSPNQTDEASDSGIYKPYGFVPTSGVGEACDVRRWVAGTNIAEGIEFNYRLMLQLSYTGDDDIRIHLPDCVVAIGGQHLLDLRKRLMRHSITFIQQYHPRIWPAPTSNEPIIDRIEIVRGDSFRKRNE